MQKRIEQNLIKIQEEFLLKTEIAAEEIFARNHELVFGKLNKVKKRQKEIDENHDEWKIKFDTLFESNEKAVVLHNKIAKTFEEESNTFFSERLKWKSDAKMVNDI